MLAAPSGLSPSACGGCPAAAGLLRAADRPSVCDLAEPWRCKLLDLERDAGLRRAASGAAGCCSAANGLICMSLGMRARANVTWLLYCTGFRPARLRRLIQAGNISRIACAHAHLTPHGRAGADDKHSSLLPCSQPAGIGHGGGGTSGPGHFLAGMLDSRAAARLQCHDAVATNICACKNSPHLDDAVSYIMVQPFPLSRLLLLCQLWLRGFGLLPDQAPRGLQCLSRAATQL